MDRMTQKRIGIYQRKIRELDARMGAMNRTEAFLSGITYEALSFYRDHLAAAVYAAKQRKEKRNGG